MIIIAVVSYPYFRRKENQYKDEIESSYENDEDFYFLS